MADTHSAPEARFLGFIAVALLGLCIAFAGVMAVSMQTSLAALNAGPVAEAAGGAPLVAQAEGGAEGWYTDEQATRGKESYDAACAACHGAALTEAPVGPPLAGPQFAETWNERSVGELFAYAHDNMPPQEPGSLPDETYADIMAYVLQANGFPAGEEELPPDPGTLDQLMIQVPQQSAQQ